MDSADLNCPACGPLPAFASGARAAGALVPRFCPTCGGPLATRASAVEIDTGERTFSAEEIIAWRAWRVIRLGKLVRLGSVTHKVKPWPVADWVYADCDGDRHCRKSSDGRVPGENCHCGLYAAKNFRHLTNELGYADYKEGDIRVIGQVGMAGKVIEGTQGWKAERARLVHLYVPHTHWKLGKQIAEQYHVPFDTIRWLG